MSDRRTFLKSAAMGAPAMMIGSQRLLAQTSAPEKPAKATMEMRALTPPANGPINVAFVISKGADVLDIGGSWEVFGETMLTAKGKPWHETDSLDDMLMPFKTYTVSDSLSPVVAGNGLIIVPNYSFETAPKPHVVVVPAQEGRSPAQKAWLLSHAGTVDVTMSVCTGAAVLAQYEPTRRLDRDDAPPVRGGHAKAIPCRAFRERNTIRRPREDCYCWRPDLGHRPRFARRRSVLRARSRTGHSPYLRETLHKFCDSGLIV